MITDTSLEIPRPVKQSEREPLVLSRRIKLFCLFVMIFVCVRVTLHQINNSDYIDDQKGFLAILHGQNPYLGGRFAEPPWAAYLMYPIVQQPVETWLALDVAIFVTAALDLGKLSGLLLIGHPIFIFLIASANPEWLFVGTGLWLLYRAKRGWFRGLAWLILACKPQTIFFVLLLDGWRAFRQRDWKAFALSGSVAVITLIPYTQIFSHQSQWLALWQSSTLPSYGVGIAVLATIALLLLRWGRLRDLTTLGILLAPIWSPYFLEYNSVATIFTLRGAGWIRTVLYMVGSFAIGLATFTQFHVAEAAGILGITLLASLLAPAYKRSGRV